MMYKTMLLFIASQVNGLLLIMDIHGFFIPSRMSHNHAFSICIGKNEFWNNDVELSLDSTLGKHRTKVKSQNGDIPFRRNNS